MIHKYSYIYQAIGYALCLATAFDAYAQSRRIVTYHSVQIHGGAVAEMHAYLSDDVDEQPQFPGGDSAMLQFINRERTYPAAEYNAGVQGRVLCSFIIGADGRVHNVEVVRGCTEGLNQEAVRVIRSMPRWKAGKVDGSPVPVLCILPIPFRL